jgi:hypothetical protein
LPFSTAPHRKRKEEVKRKPKLLRAPMILLCFGSKLVEGDDTALKVGQMLKELVPDIKLEICEDPWEVLDYSGDVVILDAVKGIDRPTFLNINHLKESTPFTLHDLDLGFFLKLVGETSTLNLRIVGIPRGASPRDAAKTVKKLLENQSP